ncbi:glycosyltransferase [Micromonospora rifamycinica]|uniref:UDP:flavonoid glycosyltransferase YjiC, YdhE family n=1 Tax=Micromonospora rifamycinica TaxID=291594 RepID=A0A120F9E4_9ACTN|nr:glycosyltransferase [Micromonospora rifamycinica]KWV33167.1 UDP-glucuronosyltransferase [Micromonospora rifamycinica]SCG51101.1 UDP:flavonoid glycosyltransferase YjiC, YdhE family [Micromonospora rifamycinica]
MARFLFVVLPVVSHLNAPLAIAQALEAAGHEVAWCGPRSDLRPLIGPDATLYPTGKRYYRLDGESGMASVRSLWEGHVLPVNRFIRDAADRAVADHRPDVVVVDQYALAGALAAHRHGVPWATFCVGTLELTPPTWEMPEFTDWVRAQLPRVWAMTDLPVDETIDLRFSPYLVIGLTSTALTGATPLPAQCVLTGPALGHRPDAPGFAWNAWDPARRHVLVTVGTMAEHLARDFYQRMMAATAPLADRVQVVLTAPPDLVPDPPAHVLVAPRVPVLELMPRLDALVSHGGLGTVSEALAHGVPVIVAPIRHDHPAVARQVVEAGAGIEVSFGSATPAELTAALTALLDEPGYRAQARRVGASFAAAGGAVAAARHLAALAARHIDHCPTGTAPLA